VVNKAMKKMWQSALLATVAVMVSNTNVWALGGRSAQKIESSTSNMVAQRQPLCLNIAFSNGPVIHRGRVVLDRSGRGVMRVGFRDRNGRETVIEQAMVLRESQRGWLLIGSNPVYAGTRRRAPNYSADNFIIERQPNGDYVVASLDDGGNTSPAEVSTCN
jgi:hypothetical protein